LRIAGLCDCSQVWPRNTGDALARDHCSSALQARFERATVAKHFITGAAQSVTDSVQRIAALRKDHPEWEQRPNPKVVARVAAVKAAAPARSADPDGDRQS
jgi:hypothetical protein